jgi:glycosyltransferase involved in cell wall biosynthesis
MRGPRHISAAIKVLFMIKTGMPSLAGGERSHRHDHEAADWTRLPGQPDISVGIVTFNHEAYLAQALDSVLLQDISCSYEVVIYEDCSSDRTREIALDYQRRFPDRIRVLYSDRNLGVAENVRRGLAACRGRYIAGLDGDDFWTHPQKLQKQFQALEARPEINLCITRGHRLMPDGSMELDWDFGDQDRIVPQRELLKRPGMISASASAFYRASTIHGSPDWIFNAPVMDLFHMLAGTSPNGAYYLAYDAIAYRVLARGSWTEEWSDGFDKIKVEYSRKMLDNLKKAEIDFIIPSSILRSARNVPRFIVGRDALARRDIGTAFRHLRHLSPSYMLLLIRGRIEKRWPQRKL